MSSWLVYLFTPFGTPVTLASTVPILYFTPFRTPGSFINTSPPAPLNSLKTPHKNYASPEPTFRRRFLQRRLRRSPGGHQHGRGQDVPPWSGVLRHQEVRHRAPRGLHQGGRLRRMDQEEHQAVNGHFIMYRTFCTHMYVHVQNRPPLL